MLKLPTLLLLLPGALCTLAPYTGPPPPYLAARTPLGAAHLSTAGAYSSNNSYIVDTMPSLRSALQLPSPKTIYVNGTLLGNHIADNGTNTYADCQWYIEHSASPGFNFTMYILSLNETYVAMVNAAVAASGTWEGEDAAAYRTRLGKMNGWRGQAQNGQKAWEAVEVGGGTGLVGWNKEGGDALVGVNVKLSSVDNVHVRNLRIVPPRDCFPAPETFPATWNARYDAISAVTATNIWLDGLILEDGPEDVPLEPSLNGWLIDRFDGLFDAEDGSDNITFSHNIVRNHHKSLLFGGGNKEADRDLGKMRFTIYGNHFNNSDSRNPLMRFGTFHIVNNLFASTNNKAPLFGAPPNATDGDDADTDVHPFQYHFGVYNQSSVLVSGNVFRQDGKHAEDTTRVFTYSDLTRADIPARLCVRADDGGVGNTFNGASVDLEEVSRDILEYQVGLGKAVEGGLVWGCEGFGETGVEGGFTSAEEVEAYVLAQAGTVG